jgi:hypothetical protein
VTFTKEMEKGEDEQDCSGEKLDGEVDRRGFARSFRQTSQG